MQTSVSWYTYKNAHSCLPQEALQKRWKHPGRKKKKKKNNGLMGKET